MFRRIFYWFRRSSSTDELFEPPSDLLERGLIGDKPELVIAEDRFRVGIFPVLHEGKSDPTGTSRYCLGFQFRPDRKWTSLLVLPEEKLDVNRDVLYVVGRFLDEQRNRPRRLPTIHLGDRRFYVDQRLSQLRNVDDPSDFVNV